MTDTVQLRPYQREQMVDPVRERLRNGVSRVVVQGPTGCGKRYIFNYMATEAARRGKRVMIVVHRHELLQQASRGLDEVRAQHGLIAAGHTMTHDRIQVASVQTLVKRLDRIPEPQLLIFDECHHAAAGSWRKIIDAWPNAKMIGLTATPCRLDGKGLDDIFEDLVIGPSIRELIDGGHLADYRVYAPPIGQGGIDTSGIKTRAGDYAKDQLAAAVDKPTITGDAVQHYLRLCSGRRAIVFCVSIDHSKHVAASFRNAGVRAEHLDGGDSMQRRERVIAAFARGEVKVLSAVDLFQEGLDIPGAEAAIILRPTQSLGMYLQMVGRVLRAAEGKDKAIILDHANCVLRHGLPDDDREWTLQGRKKRKGKQDEAVPPVRQCPNCYACHAPAPTCPACCHVYESQGRAPEQQDGELQEVDPEELRRQRRAAEKKAKTREDLRALAEARGYKNPDKWAEHVVRGREKKRQRIAEEQVRGHSQHRPGRAA